MPLYTNLPSLSQTAASNAADGAVDAPSTIDQQLNLLASFIAQLRDGVGTNYQLGPRNLLINATGAVNQRVYVTGTATTGANQYTLDRWRVVTSGQSAAFGAASPDRTMTAPAGGLEQVIEGSSVIGGVYTLSWSGTATATVNGAAITNGGNTASLPANTNVTVRFSSGTVSLPQFELGTVATPFERRTYADERERCRLYFQTSYEGQPAGTSSATTGRIVVYSASTSSYVLFPLTFAPRMRTSPTLTIYNPNTGAVGSARNESSGADFTTGIVAAGGTGPGFASVATVSAPPASQIMSIHYAASAEL